MARPAARAAGRGQLSRLALEQPGSSSWAATLDILTDAAFGGRVGVSRPTRGARKLE
jgi:hypothetical protein